MLETRTNSSYSQIRINPKIKLIGTWLKLYPSTKFGPNPSITFWDILLTNRQTDQHTDRCQVSDYLHNLVGGGNDVFWEYISYLHLFYHNSDKKHYITAMI